MDVTAEDLLQVVLFRKYTVQLVRIVRTGKSRAGLHNRLLSCTEYPRRAAETVLIGPKVVHAVTTPQQQQQHIRSWR